MDEVEKRRWTVLVLELVGVAFVFLAGAIVGVGQYIIEMEGGSPELLVAARSIAEQTAFNTGFLYTLAGLLVFLGGVWFLEKVVDEIEFED